MSKWRNEVDIKQYFTEETNGEQVSNLVSNLAFQLRRILKIEREAKINKIDSDFLDDFEEVIEDCEFVKQAIENNEDSTKYEFDTWTDAFNEYLNKLYDIGDTVNDSSKSFYEREKFLWIG